MIVIICAKYKENPARTVDATERTLFSKSRLNDLEDIGQGQGSSHATHPLMLVIICTKYGKNPSRTIDATELTRDAGRTDGQKDRRTDGVKPISPQHFRCVGGITTTSLCGGYNDDFTLIFVLRETFMIWNSHLWNICITVRSYIISNRQQIIVLDNHWLGLTWLWLWNTV